MPMVGETICLVLSLIIGLAFVLCGLMIMVYLGKRMMYNTKNKKYMMAAVNALSIAGTMYLSIISVIIVAIIIQLLPSPI